MEWFLQAGKPRPKFREKQAADPEALKPGLAEQKLFLS